jgi:hypothetical protein
MMDETSNKNAAARNQPQVQPAQATPAPGHLSPVLQRPSIGVTPDLAVNGIPEQELLSQGG